MKYKEETLKKYEGMAWEIYDELLSGDLHELKPCISYENVKIGRVMNVSMAAVLSCLNCSECKGFCYDIKAAIRFPKNVLRNRVKNFVLAKHARDIYKAAIIEACRRRRKNKFFRWHVAGEILDRDYLEMMIEIARMFPDFKFWTYTKVYGIINSYVKNHGGSRAAAIPENLVIMFSEWDGMKMPNPYDFPFFTVKLEAGNKNHPAEFFNTLYRCPGNCDICKELNRGCIAGENTYNDEH